jgi:hypothetical protein
MWNFLPQKPFSEGTLISFAQNALEWRCSTDFLIDIIEFCFFYRMKQFLALSFHPGACSGHSGEEPPSELFASPIQSVILASQNHPNGHQRPDG